MTVAIQPVDLADFFYRKLRGAVLAFDANSPRSKQTGIGASQLGHPCNRHLAHIAIQTPRRPQLSDPWAAIVGTSCHAHIFTKAFENNPEFELPKGSIEIGPGIRGTADLIHLTTGTIIDFKVVGKSSMDKLKRHGPSTTYRVQAHAYGFGYKRLGYHVQHVAIAAWPRSGLSRDLHIWTEPYDEQVVEEAFARWYPLVENADQLRAYPDLIDMMPKADGPCGWCEFKAPQGTPPLEGCPGVKP